MTLKYAILDIGKLPCEKYLISIYMLEKLVYKVNENGRKFYK